MTLGLEEDFDLTLKSLLEENAYDATPMEFQLLTSEVYNRIYDINPIEGDESHPWYPMLASDSERIHDVLTRDFFFDEYTKTDVKSFTGLSWKEFLQLDYDEAVKIIKKTHEHNQITLKREQEAADEAAKRVNASNAAVKFRRKPG